MSRPIPHPGPADVIAINHASHAWSYDGSDCRCLHCDSRLGTISADYPCGCKIPRTGPPLFDDEWTIDLTEETSDE